MITGHVVGFDIDILQQEAADALDAEIRRLYPGANFCVRYGMAPKRLFMFRAAEPFATFRVLLMAPASSGLAVLDGRERGGPRLEVLGTGSQFVAFGIHPDTIQPYRWEGGCPIDTRVEDLPEITKVAADALAENLAGVLRDQFGYTDRIPVIDDDEVNVHFEQLTDTRGEMLSFSARRLLEDAKVHDVVDEIITEIEKRISPGKPFNKEAKREEAYKKCYDWIKVVSMCTGRAILGEPPKQRYRVWLHNADDDSTEMYRRIAACCKLHEIPMKELEGWLFVSGKDNFKIKVVKGNNGGSIPDGDTIAAVVKTIRDNEIDIAIFDPLIHLHTVIENNNTQLAGVAEQFSDIANVCDCSIDIVHHVRKMMNGVNEKEFTSENSRGGGALRAAVRALRVGSFGKFLSSDRLPAWKVRSSV